MYVRENEIVRWKDVRLGFSDVQTNCTQHMLVDEYYKTPIMPQSCFKGKGRLTLHQVEKISRRLIKVESGIEGQIQPGRLRLYPELCCPVLQTAVWLV